MNLVKAELSRLLSRRFVQILTVLLFVVFGITVAVTLASTRVPNEYDWQQAREQANYALQEAQNWEHRCVAAHEAGTPAEVRRDYPDDEKACHIDTGQYKAENYLYDAFNFRNSILVLVGFLTAYLAFFGFLVSASFIGAEISSGGVTNLLLWRPQRMRVLGAKLGVLLGVLGAFFVVFTLLYVGTFWLLAHTAGYVGTIEYGFWGKLTLFSVRGVALALAASAISFGIAAIGRHTAAALGLLTGYAVVWEGGGHVIMQVLGMRFQEPFFLSTYVGAWMAGKLELYDPYNYCYDSSGPCSSSYVLTWVHGGGVLAVLVLLIVGAAFALFRKRDLT